MNGLPTREPARGFSLIELAIVVAIVMTLLTLGLGLMNAQLSSTAHLTTKKRQEAIKDALIAYLGAHRRLPCPYVPTEGSPPITGIDADPDPNPFNVPSDLPCASFGVIPFATLGLARDLAEDGWGNLFSYQVFSDPSPISCPGPARVWGRSACFGAGKAAAQSILVLDNTAGTNLVLTPNAIAVVISHGPNGLGAWAAQATRNAPPVSCEERKNANGDLTGCDDFPPATTTPSVTVTSPYYYFKGERQDQDDVVAWIDGAEAINTLAKQGAIKSAIAQVNVDLSLALDTALGELLSQGCSWTGGSSPFSSPTDPWGNAYQPQNIITSVFKSMPADANPAFCVYSYGPDGPSGSPSDDVTLCMTTGAVVSRLATLNWPNCP